MAKYRRGRINDEMQKAVAEIIRGVKDPRVSGAFISITGADVTADLKFAKIYYSVLGANEPEKKKEIAKGLKSSSGYIRGKISVMLNLRITPELTFIEDTSINYGAHIASLLEGITYADDEAENYSDEDEAEEEDGV